MHSFPRRTAIIVVTLVAAAAGQLPRGEIYRASQSGNLEKVRALLAGNPNLVFKRDKFGNTPLHYAADNHHVDVMELLLANKAEVNAYNKNGNTPLHVAVQEEHSGAAPAKDAVELLLGNKADVNAKNHLGMTPMHIVLRESYSGVAPPKDMLELLQDMLELLLANGADVNAKDDIGMTPLHMAAGRGYITIVELLLANKADVNAKTKRGETPLFLAAEPIRRSIQMGPPHFSVGVRRYDVVKSLVAHGADIEFLIADLSNENSLNRLAAVMTLDATEDPRAVDPLVGALRDVDPEVASRAAKALEKMKDPRASNALLAALTRHDLVVIAGAYPFFIRIGESGSEEALVQALNAYGGSGMAEAFLNCGNPVLGESARKWAQAKGYQIFSSPRGDAAKWGSGRQ